MKCRPFIDRESSTLLIWVNFLFARFHCFQKKFHTSYTLKSIHITLNYFYIEWKVEIYNQHIVLNIFLTWNKAFSIKTRDDKRTYKVLHFILNELIKMEIRKRMLDSQVYIYMTHFLEHLFCSGTFILLSFNSFNCESPWSLIQEKIIRG